MFAGKFASCAFVYGCCRSFIERLTAQQLSDRCERVSVAFDLVLQASRAANLLFNLSSRDQKGEKGSVCGLRDCYQVLVKLFCFTYDIAVCVVLACCTSATMPSASQSAPQRRDVYSKIRAANCSCVLRGEWPQLSNDVEFS